MFGSHALCWGKRTDSLMAMGYPTAECLLSFGIPYTTLKSFLKFCFAGRYTCYYWENCTLRSIDLRCACTNLWALLSAWVCMPAQSCPTACDPVDCSPPGSSVHGTSQARILEWVAISFSEGSSWPRHWTPASFIAGRFFTIWAIREAHCYG